MEPQNNKIVIYQTPDGNTSIDVKLDGDTVRLAQTQMSELFQKDRNVITHHINNVLAEGELDKKSKRSTPFRIWANYRKGKVSSHPTTMP